MKINFKLANRFLVVMMLERKKSLLTRNGYMLLCGSICGKLYYLAMKNNKNNKKYSLCYTRSHTRCWLYSVVDHMIHYDMIYLLPLSLHWTQEYGNGQDTRHRKECYHNKCQGFHQYDVHSTTSKTYCTH